MRIRKQFLALCGALLVSVAAWALELDQAKSQGLVGEQVNGYLGVVASQPSAEVRALVQDINAKRRQAYQRIANDNGIALEQVAALAGKKAIEKTPRGQYVQDPASGSWMKR